MLFWLLPSCSWTTPTPLAPRIVLLPIEVRASEKSLPVYTRPDPASEVRGYVAAHAAFRLVGRVPTPADSGCVSGWAQLEAKGFLCLDGTAPTALPAVAWPEVVQFDPPEPDEFHAYLETGLYAHDRPELLTPAVYAKRWRRFEGHLYASLDAFVAGEAPVGQLQPGAGNKYKFERIVETDKGPVLTRDDGKVARLDDVYLYPITRLHGHDLSEHPLPEGSLPAFAIAHEGAPLHASCDAGSAAVSTLPYHTPLVVHEVAGTPGWWAVEGAEPLFVQREHIRKATRSVLGRPSGVQEGQRWVEVDLAEQGLMVYEGDALVYFTLVSSGAGDMGTPLGTYRIYEKHGLKDMVSRAGAQDTYHVEDVPWTMVWKPHYSLHTAYWHWGFGRPASHGCVNLAPSDAHWLYDHVGPKVPPGWSLLYPRGDEGGVVRIRRGDNAGDDHRTEALLD